MLSYAVCGTGAVSRARQRHNIRAGGVRSIIAEGLYAVELITSTEGVVVVAGYSQWSKGESAVEDRIDAEKGQSILHPQQKVPSTGLS